MKTEIMFTSNKWYQPVSKEARTPSSVKDCKTCGNQIHGMCFVLFMLREQRQWVVVGWQCFQCDREGKKEWKD